MTSNRNNEKTLEDKIFDSLLEELYYYSEKIAKEGGDVVRVVNIDSDKEFIEMLRFIAHRVTKDVDSHLEETVSSEETNSQYDEFYSVIEENIEEGLEYHSMEQLDANEKLIKVVNIDSVSEFKRIVKSITSDTTNAIIKVVNSNYLPRRG